MLKMLIFKNKKQYIAVIYYRRKLSLFGRDDTRQGKSFIFIVISQAEHVPKVKKK